MGVSGQPWQSQLLFCFSSSQSSLQPCRGIRQTSRGDSFTPPGFNWPPHLQSKRFGKITKREKMLEKRDEKMMEDENMRKDEENMRKEEENMRKDEEEQR